MGLLLKTLPDLILMTLHPFFNLFNYLIFYIFIIKLFLSKISKVIFKKSFDYVMILK
jgi:hypothetical protein